MDKKIRKIADHYGVQNQIKIAIEELAELIQALSKWQRCDFGYFLDSKNYQKRYEAEQAKKSLIEEFADVEIMLQQLDYLLGMRVEIITEKIIKLQRQLERIEEEG